MSDRSLLEALADDERLNAADVQAMAQYRGASSMDDIFGGDPPPMALVNLHTGARLDAQYNPAELKETLAVQYASQQVVGLSHQIKNFINTDNNKIGFDLYYTATNTGAPGLKQVMAARRFIRSLCYPRGVAGTIKSAGAPRTLFVWPNFLSVTAILTNVEFKHSRWNKQSQLVTMTATLTLEEILDELVTSEDVFANDSFASASLPKK